MTYIIGEIGVNHNGDINTAKRIIDEAKNIGLSAIKIQSYKTEKLVTKGAETAQYQKNNVRETNQYDMLKKYELTFEEQKELFTYAHKNNIEMISTPFDEESLEELIKLNVSKIKVGSGDLTNIPFLKTINTKKKPVILSTGMSSLGEIEIALEALCDCDVALLHCTSNYPTDYEDVNLKAMQTLKHAFNTMVGYSDHTEGSLVSCLAVSLGAEIIEKHLTLDREMEGPDHKASLDTLQMKEFVQQIFTTNIILGNGIKKPTKTEESTKLLATKSICLSKDLKKGDKLNSQNTTIKRPGDGIKPKYLEEVYGLKINKDLEADTTLKWDDLVYGR